MKRSLPHSLLPLLIWAAGSAVSYTPTPALGQSMTTCNLTGKVSGTAAGLPLDIPLGCTNETMVTATGTALDTKTLASATLNGPVLLSLPLSNLASAQGLVGSSQREFDVGGLIFTGRTETAGLALFQNAGQATAVKGALQCLQVPDTSEGDCAVAVSIGSLDVPGTSFSLQSIPPNTAQPVSLPFEISTPLGPIGFNFSGSITLNRVNVAGLGTPAASIEHAPVALTVSANISVPLIPALDLEVLVQDYARWTPGVALTQIHYQNVPIGSF